MNPEKSLQITFITLGLFIFLAAGGLAGMKYTSRPDFCLNCHIMKPAVASWSVTSHKAVSCLECHIDPGWTGYFKRKIGGIGEVYRYVTGNYDDIFNPKINNANCLNCHSGKSKLVKAKDITASEGPKAAEFSHQNFLKENRSCLECHNDTGHGEKVN